VKLVKSVKHDTDLFVQPDLDAAELFEFKRDMLRENVLQQLIGLFLFLRQLVQHFLPSAQYGQIFLRAVYQECSGSSVQQSWPPPGDAL